MSFRLMIPTITTMNTTTSNPPRVTPRCLLLSRMRIVVPPRSASPERAEAPQLVQVEPDEERLAHDILVGHESPDAAVARVVSVVAHHEIVARRNRAGQAAAIVVA